MADLRSLLTSLGLSQVATLLQSGNALFTAKVPDAAKLGARIEAELQDRLGLDVRVLVRSVPELRNLVDHNPLPQATAEPSRFFLTFLSEDPAPDRIESIRPGDYAPDEFRFGDRAIYVWYRDGLLKSRLTYDLWEKRLGIVATARNWNTVTRLAELGAS